MSITIASSYPVLASDQDIRAATPINRPLKPTSALQPDPKFFIPAKERADGALYFYNNKFRGYPTWTFASLVASVLFPYHAQKPINKGNAKPLSPFWKSVFDIWTKSQVNLATKVKKDVATKSFRVTFPVFVSTSTGYPSGLLNTLVLTLGDANFQDDETYKKASREFSSTFEGEFDLKSVRAKGNLTEKEADCLRKSRSKLIIRLINGYQLAFLEMTFNQRECEFLCNSAFIEIRPLDMFSLISAWVAGGYGVRAPSPVFAIPLARIAKQSEAKKATPRLNEDGVVMDNTGSFMYIPKELNQISKYEEAASDSLQLSDGSYSVYKEDGTYSPPPISMPVYVDWTNLKLAYTTTVGNLDILNLDRSQPANNTHVFRFLKAKVVEDRVESFITMAYSLMAIFGISPIGPDSAKPVATFLAALDKESGLITGKPLELCTLLDAYDLGERERSGTLYEFFVACRELQSLTLRNLENAFKKYSVINVLKVLGTLITINKYLPKFGEVQAKYNTDQIPYRDQDPKPDFELAPLPFLKEDMGLLPHQNKVQSQLSGEPDNAIMPVDAGGGKTPLILIEVLKEIKSNPNALCLVACPRHLVAQYIKEFAHFVGNNVNLIPLTSFVMKRKGIEAVTEMLRTSPRNSVVFIDYNVITWKALTLAYGTTSVRIYPIIDFLRQFEWTFAACDESHFLKNGSARNEAMGKILVEIKKKRLASGTMAADSILDLVRQIALLDPSIFGSPLDFIRKYALEIKGNKVISWKPGAELAVSQVIKENAVIAGAKRKEWAAILPTPIEVFHKVELTDAQYRAYNNILTQVQEELLRKAETDSRLAALIKGEDLDEDEDFDIEALLKPYLARLERFITAPAYDPLGKEVLSGDDRISPKVIKIVDICRKHLDQGLKGKILIFTNYEFSAQAIYEAFPSDLKSKVIYYTAGEKETLGAQFERDDSKQIMVGIEQSMNTGLNLQFCSRLIRVETVWSPGVLEQGNSRIGRPNIKVREVRDNIYYDWIAANYTIDVTKISYLLAKSISVAKFYEAGNPRFDVLEVPPLLRMNLSTVFSANDFTGTLVEYFQKYQEYKRALEAEKIEFKEANKAFLFDKDGRVKMSPLKVAPAPKDCSLLYNAPYVPGLELSGAEKLGLVRYDAYMHLQLEEEDSVDEEDDSEDEEVSEEEALSEKDLVKKAKRLALIAEREKAIGLKVHTDKGDGVIVRVTKRLKIKTSSGETFFAPKLATFVITKPNTSGFDTRTQLLKTTSSLPLDKEVKAIGAQAPKKTPRQRIEEVETVEDNTVYMDLSFTVVNDFLGIRLNNIEDEAAVRVAQANGFRHPPDYYAAQIKLPRHMYLFFKGLSEAGFEVDKENSRACFKVWEHFRMHRSSGTNFFGVANDFEIKNFYRKEFRPEANRMKVNPYPLMQDGQLFLALPKRGHPGSQEAMRKVRIPGLRWFEYASEGELVCFAPSKPKASAVIKNLLNEGVEITNIEKLKKQFQNLKLLRTDQKED